MNIIKTHREQTSGEGRRDKIGGVQIIRYKISYKDIVTTH